MNKPAANEFAAGFFQSGGSRTPVELFSATADLANKRSVPVRAAVSEVSAPPESAREIVAAVLKHSEHGHAALTERLESSDAYLSQFIFLPQLVLQVARLPEEARTLVSDSDRLPAQLRDSEEISAVLKHYASSTSIPTLHPQNLGKFTIDENVALSRWAIFHVLVWTLGPPTWFNIEFTSHRQLTSASKT